MYHFPVVLYRLSEIKMIFQVHRAVTKDGLEVAMKIQYPGVADSIESDIENVKLILDYTNLLPEKMYLDSAMKVRWRLY